MRPWSRAAVLAVAIAAVATGCSRSAGDGLGLVEVDRPLPSLSGPTVQGGRLVPADYAGHVTVVNFWATWCGPCRSEQPTLQHVWATFRDRGVEFVGVNERDDHAAAAAWIDEFGVTYPSVEDEAGGWADDFALTGAPTTFVADAAGRIRYLITGAVTEEQLTSVLDDALSGSGSA